MLVNTYIVALVLGATTCLAAPVPEPGCTTSTVAARGYGIVCVVDSAVKRVAAEGSTQGSQGLEKRTGMGIISSNDDA